MPDSSPRTGRPERASGGCSTSSTANLVGAVESLVFLGALPGKDGTANHTTLVTRSRRLRARVRALSRAADLRAAGQSPLVEVQCLSHATGAAGNAGEGIVGTVDRHFQLCLQPPVQPQQEGATSG